MNAKKKRSVGCLLALAIYIPVIIIMYFITVPDEVTKDFTGKNARVFSIAIVHEGDNGNEYSRTTLEVIGDADPDRPTPQFLLPEPKVVMSAHNTYRVNVLEDHGDWQLIEFNYSNTYTSRSVYRAYADRVEPVSFQLTSHVGQAMMALMLIIPVYFIAWLITFIRNRRANKVA
ncbi:MAG: hypothetical protein OEU90_00955 [Gammaproteobacteria bacterium]|jgi:hypothetical protein|nr:hypothetical protein [Gammaproteobacteria bacterium]MDH3751315.1 hypothetical protein [Gammaproteobacteria bacterium]MDH3804017.1 hypothetical protein [Gammaproteobacteria bacterium]